MRVIAVANQKGGVGKTTTVANLGAALKELGYAVALIDMDAQGALSISLGLDPYTIQPSTYNLLMDPSFPIQRVLRPVNLGMQLAPANSQLIAAEYQLLRKPDRALRLRKALRNDSLQFDFVLIDTPPSLGLLTVNALGAASEILIPVATEYLSMRGVRPLLDTVWKVREYINPELHLLGVIPTMYSQESPFARQALKEIRSVFRQSVFGVPITRDEDIFVAPAARQTVLEYKPRSSVADAYRHLAKEVSNTCPGGRPLGRNG
jgi:chromosome partitioning protein